MFDLRITEGLVYVGWRWGIIVLRNCTKTFLIANSNSYKYLSNITKFYLLFRSCVLHLDVHVKFDKEEINCERMMTF